MTHEGTLEADEFVCVECGRVAVEHPKDGMGECAECVDRLQRAASRSDREER